MTNVFVSTAVLPLASSLEKVGSGLRQYVVQDQILDGWAQKFLGQMGRAINLDSVHAGQDEVSALLEGPVGTQFLDIGEFLELIHTSSLSGKTPNVDVVYDHFNLFGRLPKKYLRAIGVRTEGSGSRTIEQLSIADQLSVLRQTHWYKRLSGPVRHRIRSLVSGRKLLEIREAVTSVDGLMSSLMLSFPGESHIWKDYNVTDQIMVSFLSNILFDKTFLPAWKKYKKQLRKAVLTSDNYPVIDRRWSWMSKFKIMSASTKYGRTCLMNFTQTRSTGLGGPEGDQLSVDKLVKTVTFPEVPITGDLPSRFLRIAFSDISKKAFARAVNKTHASISTTACYEGAASLGGKARAVTTQVTLEKYRRIRNDAVRSDINHLSLWMAVVLFIAILITSWVLVPLGFILALMLIKERGLEREITYVDLETGHITEERVPLEKVGELIFHESLIRDKLGYKYMNHCNVSVIREPGPKWRTITASSIFHAEALQPWSHALLEILRDIPECRSGISASRHGWGFASDISPEDPDLTWMFDKNIPKVGLSTDLETATDYFPWSVAADIIDVCNEVFGLPTYYGQVVKRLLTSSRVLMYNGSEICRTSRAALMGDPGTKVLLTCLNLAAIQATKLKSTWVFARCVGDDLAAIVPSVESANFLLDTIKSWDMMISEDDTYVGDHVFFTEELITIPRSIHDTIDAMKKSRRWGRSIYTDSVKIRLLLDVKKNRDDYSYTPSGRISQLGKDITYLKEKSDPTALFHLGSMIQDVTLHTEDHDGAVYFPAHIIGEGKPPLFMNPRNVLRFWLVQNRTRLLMPTLTVATEALYYKEDRGLGSRRSDILLNASVGMRHSKLEAWRVTFKPVDDPLILSTEMPSVPRYEKFTAKIYNRLSQFVISEKEINGAVAKREFIENLLNDTVEPVREFRLIDTEPNELPITPDELSEFFRVWLSDPNSFRAITLERYFDRESAEKVIGERYPLTVRLPISPIYTNFRLKPKADRLEDHQGAQLYEWLQTALREPGNVQDIPRNNLSDDEIILDDLYLNHPIFFLVTNDKKLAQALSNARALHDRTFRTYRIACATWAQGKWDYKSFGSPMDFNNVEVDMGSVQAYFAQLSIDEDLAKKAQEAIAKGTTILLQKGTDTRSFTVQNLAPGSEYESPFHGNVTGDPDDEIVFPPRNFPERYRVLPTWDYIRQ
jgi:hypothetical protein